MGADGSTWRRYLPVVRSYLGYRWRNTRLAAEVDDAVQEVFYDCFKADGVLARADPDRPGGFRAFLYGVARNAARRVETGNVRRREVQPGSSGVPEPVDEDGLSAAFDRAWARSLLRQALRLHAETARSKTDAARRRVEILRLRFQEGVPLKEIADRYELDPARVHKEYATARAEFRAALLEVVAFHHPGSRAEVERECVALIQLTR
ncbi:MAG: sigma-70 family RNA polymerase sigma factor [Planctomycetota bacterium]